MMIQGGYIRYALVKHQATVHFLNIRKKIKTNRYLLRTMSNNCTLHNGRKVTQVQR